MAKKLLIKTPVSHDGKSLVYNDNKEVVYSESIVEISAKKDFEAINAQIGNAAFKHIIEEVEVEDEKSANVMKELESAKADAEKAKADAEKALADKSTELDKAKADADSSIQAKEKEIEELKKQLAAKK